MNKIAGNRRGRVWLRVLLPVLFLADFRPLAAQPTNLEVFQQLAVQCVAEVPATIPAFVLDAPAEMPYLRPALTAAWQESDKTIYLAGAVTDDIPRLPELSYSITSADVAYEVIDRRRWRRAARLSLQYALVDEDGRLVREASCSRNFADEIPAGRHAQFELELYPETRADPPDGGTARRFVEPVVIGAAISLMAYLFFSVRSRTDQQR